MIAPLNAKTVLLTPPAAIIDNAAVTIAELDRREFDYAEIMVIIGATDIALTVMKVQESDTTGSGFTDITGAVASGTTGDGRLPTATDDDKVFTFLIDMKGRKRFLQAAVTVGDGTAGAFVTVLAKLWRAKEAPSTSTERGLGGQFIV